MTTVVISGNVKVGSVTYRPTRTIEVQAPPAHKVLMGMKTVDTDWAARVAEVGPVNIRRVFAATFNVSSIISKIKMCQAGGQLAYASLKFGVTWEQVIAGAVDAQLDQLGNAVAALGYPVRLTFDHEPHGSGINGDIQTPQQLAPWGRALTRAASRIKPLASNVIFGPTDNGHPWGTRWGTWTDAQLRVTYTDEMLAAMDVLGGDFYDGATDTAPGEPAWVKLVNYSQWAQRVGFDGPLDVGEWGFIRPEDAQPAWDVLKDPARRYWAACLFNSPEANRADLPAIIDRKWTLTNKPVPNRNGVMGNRIQAFRTILDQAGIPGR